MSHDIDTSSIIYVNHAMSPAATRTIELGVRAVIGGTIDLVVQVELENFCNQLRAQIQRNEANVRKDQLAVLNAAYHAAKLVASEPYKVVDESMEDLI